MITTVEQNYDLITRTTLKRCNRSRQDAHETLSDTHFGLARAVNEWDGRGTPLGFAFCCARWEALRTFRKHSPNERAQRLTYFPKLHNFNLHAPHNPSIPQLNSAAYLTARIYHLKLTPRERLIIEQKFISNKTHAAIGRSLKLCHHTILTDLRRALAKIAQNIEDLNTDNILRKGKPPMYGTLFSRWLQIAVPAWKKEIYVPHSQHKTTPSWLRTKIRKLTARLRYPAPPDLNTKSNNNLYSLYFELAAESYIHSHFPREWHNLRLPQPENQQ